MLGTLIFNINGRRGLFGAVCAMLVPVLEAHAGEQIMHPKEAERAIDKILPSFKPSGGKTMVYCGDSLTIYARDKSGYATLYEHSPITGLKVCRSNKPVNDFTPNGVANLETSCFSITDARRVADGGTAENIQRLADMERFAELLRPVTERTRTLCNQTTLYKKADGVWSLVPK